MANKTLNKTDVHHDLIELKTTIKVRYIKLTKYKIPDGTFAITGLRVFGNGGGKVLSEAANLQLKRPENN